MDEELKKKIIKNIEETGFPSELHVASTLIKDGWDIRTCGTFLDKDTSENREIDIVAFDCVTNEVPYVSVRLTLVIEVKSSLKRPWVVFTLPVSDAPFLESPGWAMIICTDDFDHNTLSYEDINANSLRQEESRVGISFYEAFKSPKEPSQIYEGLVKACKAAISEREPYLEEMKATGPVPAALRASVPKAIEFFQPVVVLNGLLVEARLDKAGNITIEEKHYIPITLSSFSPNYDVFSFYPDIVTLSGLKIYISSLRAWIESIKERIIKNLSKNGPS